MDFMKMWFDLKEDLNKKNSWGKNELKSLMESIEIEANQTHLKVYGDVEKISAELSDKMKERMKNKGEWF